MTGYWAEHAWLPDGVAAGVTLEIVDGRFARVEPGRPPGDSTRLAGLVRALVARALDDTARLIEQLVPPRSSDPAAPLRYATC